MAPSLRCSPPPLLWFSWASFSPSTTATLSTTCSSTGWLSSQLTPAVIVLLPLLPLRSCSPDLSLDRAYREVVSFVASPSEVPAVVNSLMANRTLLSLRSQQGRDFIAGKVCRRPSLSLTPPLLSCLVQMSADGLCEPLVSLVRSSEQSEPSDDSN
jgi:hypothetical protein